MTPFVRILDMARQLTRGWKSAASSMMRTAGRSAGCRTPEKHLLDQSFLVTLKKGMDEHGEALRAAGSQSPTCPRFPLDEVIGPRDGD